MTYEETLDYLYNSAPLFQHIGKDAYKEGLENTYLLDEYFEHPHRKFHYLLFFFVQCFGYVYTDINQ